MGKYNLTYADYQKETGTAEFPIVNLTEANIAAQTTLIGALRTATDAIVDGHRQKTTVISSLTVHDNLPSDDPNAKRENKWFIRYHEGTTLEPHTMEIPCADLELLDPNNRDHLNVAVGQPGADFITAFEAVVVGDSNQLCIVDEIVLVTRRS